MYAFHWWIVRENTYWSGPLRPGRWRRTLQQPYILTWLTSRSSRTANSTTWLKRCCLYCERSRDETRATITWWRRSRAATCWDGAIMAPLTNSPRNRASHILSFRGKRPAQRGRLDDLQETLLRPGAAHLRLPEMRYLRGHRQRRRIEGASCLGLAGVRGPHAAPSLDRRRQNLVQEVRLRGLAHQRRWESMARCRYRTFFDPALPHESCILAAMVPGRLRIGVVPGPV